MIRFLALTLAMASLSPAFAQVPDYVPAEGLVAWYPLNGDANDAGLNNLNGFENGVQATNSRAGTDSSAMYFNGTSHINLGNSPLLNPDTALSISAWSRLDAPSSTNLSTILGRNEDIAGSYSFNFGIQTIDGFQLRFGIENGSNGSSLIDFDSPVELTYGEWFHCSATFSQATGWMTVYLNGLEAGKLNVGPIEINQLDTPTLIGFYRPNGNHSFEGALDEIGIWSRALTSFEVAGLFLSGPASSGCTNELACNFDFLAFLDDGSCSFSGCLDDQACNYNAAAGCDDGSCDYSCCPGPGCCSEGMFWDWDSLACYVSKPADINMDGCVQLNDLLDLLSAYGDCAVAEWACGDPLEYQGYDYATVQIGNQCWFAENLRAENYTNGEAIENVVSNLDWYNALDTELPALCSNLNAFCESNDCGMLYNRFAVEDERGVCPTGWTVPTDSVWMQLESTLGLPESQLNNLGWRGTDEGTMLKSESLWNGTNVVGFNAKPEGHRSDLGLYQNIEDAHFWSQNPGGVESWYRMVNTNESRIYRPTNANPAAEGGESLPRFGFAARCIQN